MNIIVAVAQNWGIGYKNQLLARIPEDQRFFRATTQGKTIIMGRKTLESLPGGQPLKNRHNVVLSRTGNDFHPDIEVFSDINALLEKYKAAPDVFIIGGTQVYQQLLPLCDTLYITKIQFDSMPQCDSFFPNVDDMDEWEKAESGEKKAWEGGTFRFETYVRT